LDSDSDVRKGQVIEANQRDHDGQENNEPFVVHDEAWG
jgi:hypothetical protein